MIREYNVCFTVAGDSSRSEDLANLLEGLFHEVDVNPFLPGASSTAPHCGVVMLNFKVRADDAEELRGKAGLVARKAEVKAEAMGLALVNPPSVEAARTYGGTTEVLCPCDPWPKRQPVRFECESGGETGLERQPLVLHPVFGSYKLI